MDRVPTAARHGPEGPREVELEPLESADGWPLSLLGFRHVMVSTGSTDLRRRESARIEMAHFMASLLDEEVAQLYDPPSRLWPLAFVDEGMLVASERVAVPGAAAGVGGSRSFIAHPRVYVSSIGAAPDDPRQILSSLDLLIDGVRILPSEVEPEAARWGQLWYGVLQTAIETEAMRGRLPAAEAGYELRGAAFSMAEPLSVLAPGTDVDAPEAMGMDLAAGRIVIVPGDIGTASAWWTVEPSTGVTRSVLHPGLGGVARRAAADRRASRLFDSSYSKYQPSPKDIAAMKPGQRPARPGTSYPRYAPPAACGLREYLALVACIALRAAPYVLSFVLPFLVTTIVLEIFGW